MDIANAVEAYREEIVTAIRRLVRIKSVKEAPLPGAPFGLGCRDALIEAMKMGEELGFTVKNVDNYAGHIEMGEGEEIVGVLNHLDVVPEGGGWDDPPYEGVIKNGRIYGRGTSDNKGPAVVSLYCMKALKDLGLPLKRRVRLILGTDEESGWADMRYYLAREQMPALGFSPDAGYPIVNREKGILVLKFAVEGEASGPIRWIKGGTARNSVPDACRADVDLSGVADAEAFMRRIEALGGSVESREGNVVTIFRGGMSAHGANPQIGDNAAAHMLVILEPLYTDRYDPQSRLMRFARECIAYETDGASLGVAVSDEPSGPLTLNMGILDIDAQGGYVTADIRFPVTHTMEAVARQADAACAKYAVTFGVEKYTAPLYVKADSPLIQALSGAYERASGEKAELLSMGGGTYARVLNNNGVAFGPGFPGDAPGNAHQVNEFVDIDAIMRHAKVCAEAIAALANC